LTEVFADRQGRFKIRYREDRDQRSRKRGDEGPTDGMIYKGTVRENGREVERWRFNDAKGDDQHIIKYAIAESPTAAFRPG
jgi:hypothetical protein